MKEEDAGMTFELRVQKAKHCPKCDSRLKRVGDPFSPFLPSYIKFSHFILVHLSIPPSLCSLESCTIPLPND